MISISDRLYNYFYSIQTYISNEYAKLPPEKKITTVSLAIFGLLLGGSLLYSLHRFYQSKKLKPIDGKAERVAERIINKNVDNETVNNKELEDEGNTYSKQINALRKEISLTAKEMILPDEPMTKWFGDFILENALPTGKETATYYFQKDDSGALQHRETRTGEFKKGQLSGLGRVHNNFRLDFQIHEGIFKDGIHVEGIRRGISQGWERGHFGTPVSSDIKYFLNGEGKKFIHGILYEGAFEDGVLIQGKKTLENGHVILQTQK